MGKISDFIKKILNNQNKMLPAGIEKNEINNDSGVIKLIERINNDRTLFAQFNAFNEAKLPQASKKNMKEVLKKGEFKRQELETLYNNAKAKKIINTIRNIYNYRDQAKNTINEYEDFVCNPEDKDIVQEYQEQAEKLINYLRKETEEKHGNNIKNCHNINDYEKEINRLQIDEKKNVESLEKNRLLKTQEILKKINDRYYNNMAQKRYNQADSINKDDYYKGENDSTSRGTNSTKDDEYYR